MDSMKTEVQIVPHEIEAGEAMKAQVFEVNNFHIHSCLTQLSRSMAACAESQTSNMYSEVVPRDVASLQVAWSAFKQTFDFALIHNDPPSGSHEDIYPLWVPSKDQIMSCPNEKMKIVLLHLYRLVDVMSSCESSKSSGNIGKSSEALIKDQMAITEAAISMWLGTGSDNDNVGIAMPSITHLGTLVPDVDFDKGTTREPTAGIAQGGRPDVADKGSKV